MKNTLYDLWTDGSYRQAHGKVGAGWLIRHNGVEHEGNQSILCLKGQDKAHGSDIAEVFAVACALRKIPAGSQVFLRNDCRNVCDWLSKREITTASKTQVVTLKEWFDDAVLLVGQMDVFSVNHISGKTNENLSRVHKLSQIASSPRR